MKAAEASRIVRRMGGIAFDRIVWSLDRGYDVWYGTDTTGVIELDGDDGSYASRRHASPYEPIPTRVFRYVLEHLPIRHRDFIFVDLGSGKGRTLLMASHYAFAEIIGVELSPRFHGIAQANIAAYRSSSQQCFSIRSVCADAADYVMPDANLAVFLFNPFDRLKLAQVIENLRHVALAGRRRVYLIYCEAKHADIIECSEMFSMHFTIRVPWLTLRRPGAISSLMIFSN